jgi:hypothetical protein
MRTRLTLQCAISFSQWRTDVKERNVSMLTVKNKNKNGADLGLTCNRGGKKPLVFFRRYCLTRNKIVLFFFVSFKHKEILHQNIQDVEVTLITVFHFCVSVKHKDIKNIQDIEVTLFTVFHLFYS